MTVVETPLGRIRGASRDGYAYFRGIRYAQAPVGEARFRPPVPVTAWSGDYDASAYGASAPQPAAVGVAAEPTAEDCLFLNVYTRVQPSAGARRPVLFWIHGGGYVSGSGRHYHGGNFVREHDVVVVTVNYRMGALGFLHLGHLDASLSESVNNGILDQICALQWTRANIAAFGGDPDNILIFGESAGGTSTAMLYGAPRAEGLFSKAVLHSPHADLIAVGDGHCAFANRCIERLGGDPRSNGLRTLRAAPVAQLVALNAPDPQRPARAGLGLRRPDDVGFSPAIDGSLIPRGIAETVRLRGGRNPPLLAGGCRHEGTLFPSIVGHREYTPAEAAALFRQEGTDGERALAAYEQFAPGSTPREKLVYALTDTMFRNSTVRILDAAATAGAPCWSWMCTWEGDQPGRGLRATHAMELPFLWDWIITSPVPTMAGMTAPRDLGPAMRAYWAAFAATGLPAAPGEPAWPQHNLADRPVLVLDAERRIARRLDDGVRAYWFDRS